MAQVVRGGLVSIPEQVSEDQLDPWLKFLALIPPEGASWRFSLSPVSP